MHAHRVEVGIGQDGTPAAWRHVVVGQSVNAGTFVAPLTVKNGIGQITPRDTTIEKVAELRVPLERLVDCKRKKLVVIAIDKSFFRSFAASPLEDLAFNDAGDGESEMRSSRLHLFRSQELQQEAERLLRDVFLGKRGLIFNGVVDRAVQHWDKRENEKAFDDRRATD